MSLPGEHGKDSYCTSNPKNDVLWEWMKYTSLIFIARLHKHSRSTAFSTQLLTHLKSSLKVGWHCPYAGASVPFPLLSIACTVLYCTTILLCLGKRWNNVCRYSATPFFLQKGHKHYVNALNLAWVEDQSVAEGSSSILVYVEASWAWWSAGKARQS